MGHYALVCCHEEVSSDRHITRRKKIALRPEPSLPRIGAHISTAGGLAKVPGRIDDLSARTAQIFPSNPRRWKGPRPSREEWKALGDSLRDVDVPLFIHTIYLVNLAGPDTEMRKKSSQAVAHALEAAAGAGAAGVVTHIGSHKGGGAEKALPRVRETVLAALEKVSGDHPPPLLLEPGAGGGGSVGHTPEDYERLLSLLPENTGLCLDTAHLLAAGHAVHTESGLTAFLDELQDRNLLQRLQLIHLNDSKSTLASHLDRHENLGDGELGDQGLSRILGHPALTELPFILEVPGVRGKGPDEENMKRARRLAEKRP